MAEARLQRELRELEANPPPSCTARTVSRSNLFLWEGTITGPPKSLYAGGVFKLRFEFPRDYPTKPPHVIFTTPIYHMNILDNGEICMDILRPCKWRSDHGVRTILLGLVNMLSNPNSDDPFDGEKHKVWKTNRTMYEQQARANTRIFASSSSLSAVSPTTSLNSK